MLVVLGVGPALIALAATYWLIGSSRRRRRAGRDPLSQVFQLHELRELDAHLDVVAEEELRRLDAHIAHYVAGEVGHVVVISESRHEIALLLSDGRRMALGGVSRVMRRFSSTERRRTNRALPGWNATASPTVCCFAAKQAPRSRCTRAGSPLPPDSPLVSPLR
jgi:hypothetical protein